MPVPTHSPMFPAHGPATFNGPYGVYVLLVQGALGPFGDVVESLRQGIQSSGWEILGEYDAGVDEKRCSYRAHVMAVHSPEYTTQALTHGPMAAFALPIRLAVFEDERGIHIAAANPQSLTRTIISETAFENQATSVVETLRRMSGRQFGDKAVDWQYGQMRERGLIGKTMGLIAGGPFDSKVESAASLGLNDGETLTDVANRLYAGLNRHANSGRWQTRPIYQLDLTDHDVVVIGVTGDAMEAKAFNMVGAGSRKERKDLACPGLDHAPAFPIELVLTQEADRVNVLLIDQMFRVKMYFEDAGTMKLAANVNMPGSIEDELRFKIRESLF